MSKKRYGPYSLGIMSLLIITMTTSAFGEVSDLKTNGDSFYLHDQIKFSGNVEEGSNGLVTIVIRDINNEFVMLSQAIIYSDNTFEKTINVNEKFTEHGRYNATGFLLNMTKGVTTNFGISLNGVPIDSGKQETVLKESKSPIITNENDGNPVIQEDIELIGESIIESTIAGFVDTSKDPKYYVDRYYNEPKYASWFDRNYPGLTIEEAVGHTDDEIEPKLTVENLIPEEIIPEAQASTIVEPTQKLNDNSDIAQMSLAIAGLGILFGAVFGIKRKVDNNSNQISINREIIRKKIIHPILGSNPKEILQTRLAKGEISLEEYEKLVMKLN